MSYKYLLARISLSIMLLFSTTSLHPFDLYMAPIAVQDEVGEAGILLNARSDLRSAIAKVDHLDVISISSLSTEDNAVPRSFLDAVELCEKEHIPFLYYGYIRRTEFTWEGEIKLYDHEKREISETFFSRDSAENYERFMQDLAEKIVAYLYVDVGMAPYEPPPPPDKKIFIVPIHLDYWAPGGSDWGKITTGIGRLESGILFSPVRPLWHTGDTAWELQTGLTLAYSLAMNAQGYENFLLHSLRFNLPATAVALLHEDHNLLIGTGLSLQIDILNQERQYYGTYSATSIAPGFFLETGYRYKLNDTWSFGVRTALEIAFFDDVQTNLVPGLCAFYEASPLEPSEDR